MRERLQQELIDRGRKIIVIQNPALDLEPEHVARLRKAIGGEQASRNFSFFSEPTSEAGKILARESCRVDLFAHRPIRRLRRGAERAWPAVCSPLPGTISTGLRLGEGEMGLSIGLGNASLAIKRASKLNCKLAATRSPLRRPKFEPTQGVTFELFRFARFVLTALLRRILARLQSSAQDIPK